MSTSDDTNSHEGYQAGGGDPNAGSARVSPDNNNVAGAVRSLFLHPAKGELIRLGAAYADRSKNDRRLFDAVNFAGLKEFSEKHFAATMVVGAASYRRGPDGRHHIYRLHALFCAINFTSAEEAAAARRCLDAFALPPTMRTGTKRGARVWWTLRNSLDLTDAQQRERAESLLLRFADTFGGNPAMAKTDQLLVLPALSQADGTAGSYEIEDLISALADAARNKSKLEYALDYARHHIKVFPLFDIGENGRCACGVSNCGNSRGKHPRVKDWQVLATTDKAQIQAWWERWPNANIGVLTGVGSNLTALDVDGQEGANTLHDFEVNTEGCRELPPTPRVKTGGKGGCQLYFQHVPGLRNLVKFAPGLDIRNDGGYVVGAGSLVNSPYSFEAGFALGEIPLGQMPEWLIERIKNASTFKQAKIKPAPPNGDARDHAVTQAAIESALHFIDAEDHDTWLMVGMALHHEFGGSQTGLEIWRAWSSDSSKYNEADQQKRWASFSASGNGGPPTTILSVLKLARENGWTGYWNGDGAAGPGETGDRFEWPEPQPIGGALPEVLPMTPEMLPSAFRDFAVDTAERMAVPLDIIGLTLLITSAALIGRKVGMRPKRNDNWTVYANLWGGVIGRPSVLKKSPTMKEGLSFLYKLEKQARELCKSEGFDAEVRAARLKAAQNEINRQAKESKGAEDFERLREDYERLKAESEPRRVLVNDATTEKLSEIFKPTPAYCYSAMS
jgi:Bifunctional DNA primase/polymerase, N-terminal/Protein of unknown function (DUF3987)/Primase C terminal 2 (PriCT-2)